ncbi:DNA mismatch repair endonuclease MutL [Lichenicoccus sp.]|uniref:DNA mismatch repair endonuclease MutL n=1 Tax=Lichenicoccus sp. TaxID=2781899 RepID=UPI003D109D18
MTQPAAVVGETAPVIRRLSSDLVNRIAAGEVIERPAAVVKELVENAIDAGAGRIAVGLDGGGIARISVTDDGCGMAPDQLALAVERHCTSKLSDDTLVRIATLGFRGEALPSIGAAARLCVASRPRAAAEAWQIRVDGGAVSGPRPCAGPPGTRVLVEELFFATPARRKFLKTPRIEAGHAETVVRRLALAAPRVAFSLEIDGRMVLELPAQDRLARVCALLAEAGGSAAALGLLSVAGERDGIVLSGHACGPALHRATAAGQYLVVNGRPVADPVLRTAVRVAYRHVITHGRHPVVALFLDIAPERIDVNVHPAKTELRFADAETVRALVIGSLGRALSGGAGSGGAGSGMQALQSRPRGPGMIWAPPERRTGPGFAEATLAFGAAPRARVLEAPATPDGTAMPPTDHPLGAAVAQVLDTYVIAVASDGGLVLVDQHAAHERLTQEALQAQVLGGAVAAQRLLLPEVVDLPRGAAAALLEQAARLAALGIEIEAFGGASVLVRTLPALLGSPDPAALLRDLADELAEPDGIAEAGESATLGRRTLGVIARMACHGSIRAGRRLSRDEMDALLRRMETTPHADTCSHGRPTWLKLSRNEIERLFGRA